MRAMLLTAAASLVLVGCSQPTDTATADPDMEESISQAAADQPFASGPEGTQTTQLDPNARPPHQETSAAITGEDLAWRIQTLASDEFEGRAPATPGGILASQWLADEMESAGLMPAGEDSSYFQAVPLVEATMNVGASGFDITVNGEPMGLELLTDVVYGTRRLDETVSIENSELVFVGYGVVAPEYGWNDYAGLDVEGRTVVMLINDPGFASGDPDLFNGNAMTYYGRWTYKYEEAARQGADAVIIIHETEAASYGWNVVSGSWSGPQYDLQRPEDSMPFVGAETWITNERARELFDATGLDFDALVEAAHQPGFEPVEIPGAVANGTIVTDHEFLASRNVAGVVEGTERPDEYILYMAHWDHIGIRESFGSDRDVLYNGAIDNATGTSSILEIGQAFAANPPERSVMIIAVTAEESGLLGSEYYATSPLVPFEQTVGGLNMDGMLPTGPTSDIVVIGYGASELEDHLAVVAATQNRTLSPDPDPAAGYFYRSDHISLAKRGVPMIYADTGSVNIELGAGHVEELNAAYRARDYHQPSDEFSYDWDFDALARDATLLYLLGERVANSNDWPNWYEGNEFRALRDAQRPAD
ncbi:M28 family metallopeptidase [Hyphobacterium sp.]|uniref:M28 family metallopeptidase n=1 Tax=Hyphobacterium sp. TaxID=2004662 RepID=UPI003BABFAC9